MLGRHLVPGEASGVDDGIEVVEQAMRQEAFLQVFPGPLNGIEFGRVRRQRHQCDAGWDDQVVGAVPACRIEEQRDVLVGCDRFSKPVEKHLHGLGVRLGQDERERGVRPRLDGTIDVGERIALIDEPRRALSACEPAAADATFLADPRLVLKKDAQFLAAMCISKLR